MRVFFYRAHNGQGAGYVVIMDICLPSPGRHMGFASSSIWMKRLADQLPGTVPGSFGFFDDEAWVAKATQVGIISSEAESLAGRFGVEELTPGGGVWIEVELSDLKI